MHRTAAASVALLGALCVTAPASADGGARVVLEGVDRYRVMEPMNECARVVLTHRGETYSPAYVQGIAGSAFRIGGICPCAPTCMDGMANTDLAKLFGYETELIQPGDKAENVGALVARVKDEIRRGRPVIVWHAFTNAEYDVVCGFDEERKLFLGRGSYAGMEEAYAEADEARTAASMEIAGPLPAIAIGEKTGAFDAPAAEVAALREAVRHAHSTKGLDTLGKEKWTFLEGIACYDRWVRQWRDDPAKAPELGDRYCLGIYRFTRRSAAEFLEEIAPRHAAGQEALLRAAGHFRAEADALDATTELVGWGKPAKVDAQRNAKVAELLGQARDEYVLATAALEEALLLLGD
jgi:hypothetical protein